MRIIIEVPSDPQDPVIGETQRQGIAPPEQAALLLRVAGALGAKGPETPFSTALKSFLRRNQIDPHRLSSALDQLKVLCFNDAAAPSSSEGDCEQTIDRNRLEEFLRHWRDDAVHGPVKDAATSSNDSTWPQFPNSARPSIRGKYAYIGFTSEDHAREKQLEIDREDRF